MCRKERSYQQTDEQKEVQNLLLTVLRFDDTTYKLGKSGYVDERVDLAGLQACAGRLIYEINIEAVATGLQVNVEVSPFTFSNQSLGFKRSGTA